MTNYHEDIVNLVTQAAASGMSHEKILEPLANMVASVLANINVVEGGDERAHFDDILTTMIVKYEDVYRTRQGKLN